MWNFFRPGMRPSTSTRARLSLESLDLRSAPSTIIDPVTGLPTTDYLLAATEGDTSTAPPPPAANAPGNQAPKIINFGGGQEAGNMWKFTGDVIDEAPGGLTITFGGDPVTMRGKTVKTDANGHFELIVALNQDKTDNGLVTAQTKDTAGLPSNIALDQIEPSA